MSAIFPPENPSNNSPESSLKLEEDRTTTKLPKIASKKIGFVVIAIGVALMTIFLLPQLFKKEQSQGDVKPPPEESVSVKSKNNFNFNKTPEKEPVQKTFTEDNSDKPRVLLGAPSGNTTIASKSVQKSTRNFMVKSGGEKGQEGKGGQPSTDFAITQAEGMQRSTSENKASPDDIYKAPSFTPTLAEKSQFNPHLLLSQGTLIPCVLRGKLISNISGQISCVIADNVYSQSGNVVLVEKGSRVNGYYQGGSAQHGSNEIFAVWQEIRTPNNLVIPLMSGSTDELGANGLRGWADNHFWERFKNAIMLSMIKDVTGALASRAGKDGRTDYSQNTREGSEDVAKTVLDQMGDIRPTIYKNQGDKVGIFVARDIDFSNVYRLKARQ